MDNTIIKDIDNFCFYLRRQFVDVDNLSRNLVFDYILFETKYIIKQKFKEDLI